MNLIARQLSLVRDRATLLDAVDMEIAAGEVLAVIGPNGAGKSSLVRALSGEWSPSGGGIELGSQPLAGYDIRARARRLAVLPQQSSLDFPFTGREVVAMSRIPHDTPAATNRRVVDEVIDRLELGPLAERTYTTLSGGEKQRIQLARVFAQLWEAPESAFYLLDEPTAPLDLAHQLMLASAIDERKRMGAGIAIVMHDINLAARLCDRMLLLSRGRIAISGSPDDVLTQDHLRAAYGVEVERVERAGGAPAVFASRLADDV